MLLKIAYSLNWTLILFVFHGDMDWETIIHFVHLYKFCTGTNRYYTVQCGQTFIRFVPFKWKNYANSFCTKWEIKFTFKTHLTYYERAIASHIKYNTHPLKLSYVSLTSSNIFHIFICGYVPYLHGVCVE